MEPVARTRMQLLSLKRQIEAAERGLELLRSKREALVREFFTVMGQVAEHRGELEAATAQARSSLALALGMEGHAPLRSAGFATKRDVLIELTERNVWGVRFPDLRHAPVARAADARGYALSGVSTYLDQAARRFEAVLELILRSVSVELRLKKLGAEIKKATRRINALDEILVPSLKRQVREIRQTLEEREREDLFRMKRFKEDVGGEE
ncbi:V-type ATP synthase subunit D [Nitrospira sp. Kam-Ns4a]